jgi:hypothetical protein
MSTASGTIATAAQKKSTGAPAPTAFNTTAIGTASRSQWIDQRICRTTNVS